MTIFTEPELAFLAEAGLARIATVGVDGTPHVTPTGFTYNPTQDSIDIGGAQLDRTKKYRDVRRTGRAAVVIDDLPSINPWHVRGIEIRGHAEALDVIRIYPERVISWGIADDSPSQRHARTIRSRPNQRQA